VVDVVLATCGAEQDLFLMRMRPIFSTSRGQSDAKKPDDDWQEQFFKLDVHYIVSQQVRAAAARSPPSVHHRPPFSPGPGLTVFLSGFLLHLCRKRIFLDTKARFLQAGCFSCCQPTNGVKELNGM